MIYDSEAFEGLMSDYTKVIYNYIANYVGSKPDVEDIVQETMLGIWQNIKGYDGKSSFKTWVLAVTRRKIADFYRQRRQTLNIDDYAEGDNNDLFGADDYSRVDDEVSVKSAVSTLDSAERELVYLIFTAEMNYSQVSEITGLPVGTVKSRMSSVRAKLKKQLTNGGT